MKENESSNTTNSSDEIDLGQLLRMIGSGFNQLFLAFLGTFVYIKKNIFILVGLAILGTALGYGLNQIVDKKMKTEVIVKPNLESKNYLYDVVDEIQANIVAEDTMFFERISINMKNFKEFEVSVEQVGNENKVDIEYLELLEKFENRGVVSDVVRAEILNKSSLNHRITFYYKDAKRGQEISQKLMAYINSNEYFTELVRTYTDNAKERIQKNEVLVKQVDELIANYSEKLARKDNQINEGRIVVDNEEQMDIKGLFELKNNLIKDTESKKLELKKRTEAISVINFGKPQQVQKAFFGRNIILIPLIFVGLFFLASMLKYFNKKAAELKE